MLKLYEHPLSPYAQKVKIALYEKGLPFEAVVPPSALRCPPAREGLTLPQHVIHGVAALVEAVVILHAALLVGPLHSARHVAREE